MEQTNTLALTQPPIRFLTEPGEVYRSARAKYLSSHALYDFRRKGPRYYMAKKNGLIADPIREAFIVGAAAHCLILEGREEFDRRYIVGGPINPKTGKEFGRDTKAYAQWAESQGADCLSPDQFATVCCLTDAVRGHDAATAILSCGIAEGVLRATIGGVDCQARLDWFNFQQFCIADYKTCDCLDDFPADAVRWGYRAQLAFYRRIVAQMSGRTPECYLIGGEKQPPYRVGVWRLKPSRLAAESARNDAAMERLRRCAVRGEWPSGYERVRSL